MKLKDVYGKAKEVGVRNYKDFNKVSLIRKIQETEGNPQCFQTKNECDQNNCLWMHDCMKPNTGLRRFRFWNK